MKKKILLILTLLVIILLAFFFNRREEIDSYEYTDTEYEQYDTGKLDNNISTSSSNVGSEVKSFSLSDLSSHNSASSCWSNIFGNVYDLTSYVDKHPGGREQILAICGKNGNDLFSSQHSGNKKIEGMLKNFYIGVYTQ